MKFSHVIILVLLSYGIAFSLKITPHDSTIIREFLDVNDLNDLEITFPNLVFTNTSGQVTRIRINTEWPDLFPKPIKTIPSGFSKLEALENILLDGFSFSTVPSVLQNCKALETLSLSNGPLKIIDSLVFNIPKLKALHIGHCDQLELITNDIKTAKNLEYITIDTSSLPHVPEGISELNNLKFLEFKALPIDGLPSNLHKVTSIHELTVENCPNLTLEPSIVKLDPYVFRIKSCGIDKLPEGEYVFDSIFILNVMNNNLEKLPKGIDKVTTLTGLYIGGNQFSDLPAFLHNNHMLENLGCSNNNFTVLPEYFCTAGNQKYKHFSDVFFKHNQIDSIPEITDTIIVEVLDLSYNKLENLPKSIMKIVPDPNISRFIFDYNYLHDLDPEIEAWLDEVTAPFGWRDTQLSVGIESPEVKEVMRPNVVQYDKKSRKLNLMLKESSPVSIQLIDAKGRVIQNVFEGKKQRGSSSVDLSGIRAVGCNFYILSCTINGKRFNVPVSHIQ